MRQGGAHHSGMARRRTAGAWLSAGLLAGLLSGCASVGDYAHDRAADAVDMLRGHVMIGPGADVMVQVTRALRLGAGYYDAQCAGLANRELTTWHESVQEGGLLFLNGRYERTVGIRRLTGSYGTVQGWGSGRLLQPDETWVDLFDLRVTVMFGVGLDLEVRLGQILDFVGGFFLWDPAHDDESDD